MSYTGGELQRRRPDTPVPYRHSGQHSGGTTAPIVNLPEFTAWARGRGVVVFGVMIIAASLVWKAIFLGHYYFWQDDFHFTELALGHSFNWSYLTFVGAGHMFPGVYALIWVWARVALYNWTVASALTLIMLAACGLALLRLLRTLFGSRPAILVLLTIYLLCPLTMPIIRWWSAAMEALPLQAAIFMALDAQVRYVRTGRARHAIAVWAWLLVGLAFFEKALVLPLLLFLVTSAFLVGEGGWLRAAWRTLRVYWLSWLVQLVILGGYLVVLKNALKTSTVKPTAPNSISAVFTFTWGLLKDTFVPGAIGGPWQWFPQVSQGGSEWAYAATPTALIWLSLIVAVCVIYASVWARRYAWRAWAIIALWYLLADVVPVVLGRITELGPGGPLLLALETHYVSDAVPILVICIGLAFLPLDGYPNLRQKRRLATPEGVLVQPGRLAAAGLVGAFIIGSVWSVQAFVSNTSSLSDQIFLENARVAVADAPAGTIIDDQPVPASLMIGAFGQFRQDSRVIGPMESAQAKSRIRWTTEPDGTLDHQLLVFGTDGRLHQAAMYGQGTVPLTSQDKGCYNASANSGKLVIPFTSRTAPGSNELHVAYLAAQAANGEDVTVTYGKISQRLTIKAGLHDAYLPVRGSSNSVTVSGGPATGPDLCISGMRAGIIFASSKGPAIPASL